VTDDHQRRIIGYRACPTDRQRLMTHDRPIQAHQAVIIGAGLSIGQDLSAEVEILYGDLISHGVGVQHLKSKEEGPRGALRGAGAVPCGHQEIFAHQEACTGGGAGLITVGLPATEAISAAESGGGVDAHHPAAQIVEIPWIDHRSGRVCEREERWIVRLIDLTTIITAVDKSLVCRAGLCLYRLLSLTSEEKPPNGDHKRKLLDSHLKPPLNQK